jgi:hypothetical protein
MVTGAEHASPPIVQINQDTPKQFMNYSQSIATSRSFPLEAFLKERPEILRLEISRHYFSLESEELINQKMYKDITTKT